MEALGFAADEGAVAHVLVDRLESALTIDGDDGHHLARARRLRVGEAVTAGDGHGRWRPYAVAEVSRGALTLAATGETRREPDLVPQLAIAFALTKGVKPETVVRQLTELGVDAVLPVVAERSVARPHAGRGSSLDRLRRAAREAAMQSRRARLPDVAAPAPLLELLRRPGLVVAERAGAPGVPEAGGAGWTVLVGPEGGFSGPEHEALRSTPRLALGAHVLRADTAAVAAAAVLAPFRRPATEG
jgi:16S rRNA (uracil1498-N3)-methyltransferase